MFFLLAELRPADQEQRGAGPDLHVDARRQRRRHPEHRGVRMLLRLRGGLVVRRARPHQEWSVGVCYGLAS